MKGVKTLKSYKISALKRCVGAIRCNVGTLQPHLATCGLECGDKSPLFTPSRGCGIAEFESADMSTPKHTRRRGDFANP